MASYEEVAEDILRKRLADWTMLEISKESDPKNSKETIWEANLAKSIDAGYQSTGIGSKICLRDPLVELCQRYGADGVTDESDLDLFFAYLLCFCSLIRVEKLDVFYVELFPTLPNGPDRVWRGDSIKEAAISALRAEIPRNT